MDVYLPESRLFMRYWLLAMNFLVNWAHLMLLLMGNFLTFTLLLLMLKLKVLNCGDLVHVSKISGAAVFSLSLVALFGLIWWTGIPCGFFGEIVFGIDLSKLAGSIVFYSLILILPIGLGIRYGLGIISLFVGFALLTQAIYLLFASGLDWSCRGMQPLGIQNLIALAGFSVICCTAIWIRNAFSVR